MDIMAHFSPDMTRWTGDAPRTLSSIPPDPSVVTDDPLAALGLNSAMGKGAKHKEQVYSVSRVNPLFNFTCVKTSKAAECCIYKPRKNLREKTPEIDYDSDFDNQDHKRSIREKSSSSGYEGSSNGGSSLEGPFNDGLRSVDESGAISDHNPTFVKSIRIAGRGLKPIKIVPSQLPNGSGVLTTIPEGIVDPVPQPIWPEAPDNLGLVPNPYTGDSLVDDALLFCSNFHHNPIEQQNMLDNYIDTSVKDLLLDILASINETLECKTGDPEELLKIINEKIKLKLDVLKSNTEEEMRRLCINMSNNRKLNQVLRALSHGSSSGHSSSSGRARTVSSNEEEIYNIPSGSSSSGFSDSPPGQRRTSTPLIPPQYGRKSSILSHHLYNDHDSSTISKGIRNALIYGTLSRYKMSLTNGKFYSGMSGKLEPDQVLKTVNKDSSFSCARNPMDCLKSFNCDKDEKGEVANRDERPSVWQLYYGKKAEGTKKIGEAKPSDVPVFPGGRPEADFTLDVPRSELLSKRLREDKKWRFRCRLLTSFLGLVFFLLSVMVVSLVLTRGKRMFGSMV
ncbi:hypothetical protein ABEB36_002376 [Hypothenemus hampei]|uniref:Uncharacterized protein n=1 Tax=Hypothenemus hampei TaxID=57062 RepID=A0ABD1F977_HYPHA